MLVMIRGVNDEKTAEEGIGKGGNMVVVILMIIIMALQLFCC